jgi:hypothetical protein
MVRRGWALPESDGLSPLVKVRFSLWEAFFPTGLPHGPTRLDELAEARGADVAQLVGELDALARQGVVYRRLSGAGVRWRLGDAFFTFLRSFNFCPASSVLGPGDLRPPRRSARHPRRGVDEEQVETRRVPRRLSRRRTGR